MSFYRDTARKSRKERKCDICHGVIKVGEMYHDKAGINQDSDFFTSKECEPCQSVIAEFLSDRSNDEGYCDDWINDWWRDVKCYDCKYYYPPCKPDETCKDLENCKYKTKYNTCKDGDTCDEMTHYCRCEKFELEGVE